MPKIRQFLPPPTDLGRNRVYELLDRPNTHLANSSRPRGITRGKRRVAVTPEPVHSVYCLFDQIDRIFFLMSRSAAGDFMLYPSPRATTSYCDKRNPPSCLPLLRSKRRNASSPTVRSRTSKVCLNAVSIILFLNDGSVATCRMRSV